MMLYNWADKRLLCCLMWLQVMYKRSSGGYGVLNPQYTTAAGGRVRAPKTCRWIAPEANCWLQCYGRLWHNVL
jgi:hypothetical protein